MFKDSRKLDVNRRKDIYIMLQIRDSIEQPNRRFYRCVLYVKGKVHYTCTAFEDELLETILATYIDSKKYDREGMDL